MDRPLGIDVGKFLKDSDDLATVAFSTSGNENDTELIMTAMK